MAANNDILLKVQEKASLLEHKASFPNWKLKREIRRLSVKPDPDEDYRPSLEDLLLLSSVLKDVRRGTLRQDAIAGMRSVEAYGELASSISERIDVAILEAYDSIVRDASLPDDLFGILSDLFTRWQDAQNVREEHQGRLQQMVERLERADCACDGFSESCSRRTSDIPPPSDFDKDYFERFDLEQRNRLRHMLWSMANLFVIRRGRCFDVHPSPARLVTSWLTNSQAIGHFESKEEKTRARELIKHLRRKIRSQDAGSTRNTEFAILLPRFRQVLQLHRTVTDSMPPDMIAAEAELIKKLRHYAVLFYNSGRAGSGSQAPWIPDLNPVDMGQLGEAVANSRAMTSWPEFLARKMFLLEMTSATLESLGFDLDSEDHGHHLEDSGILTYLSGVRLSQERAVYTRRDVSDLFELFGLPEGLMDTISPLNFLFEFDGVDEALSAHPNTYCDGDTILAATAYPLLDVDVFVMMFTPGAMAMHFRD